MNELQKCAEILVECGYAQRYNEFTLKVDHDDWREPMPVCPERDTLEGRRQAEAIEDWLRKNKTKLFYNAPSPRDKGMQNIPRRQWRLERIKWCIKQLIEGESDERVD